MEVFASIQGEGAFVGEPQTFVRLRGCPLRCRWCDTPGSWRAHGDERARVHARGGAIEHPGLATPFQVACWIAEVEPGVPRTISVTGGEPLMWPRFLSSLRPFVGRRRLHLETGGGHPRSLMRVVDAFDHVSLDLKHERDLEPPVELDRGFASEIEAIETSPRTQDEWRKARARSLALLRGRDACGKVVLSGERAAGDFIELLDQVEEHAPDLLVVLQPATPIGGVPAPPHELVDAVLEMARDRDLRVRVLPQVHRALRVR